MKNFFLTAFLFAGFTLCAENIFAQDGHEHGNGGGGIVCRDPQNQILSVELLDLWEARTVGGTLIASSASTDDMAQQAMLTLDWNNPLFTAHVRAALNANNQIIVNLPPNAMLLPPTDAQPWIMPKNCKLESVAEYRTLDSGNQLYIDQNLYQKMSPLDQAALLMHEAVYKVLRDDDGDTDSIRARAITGDIFKVNGLIEVPQPQIGCFYQLDASGLTFSFAMSVITKGDRMQAWVMRAQSRWQVPALPVEVIDPDPELQFMQLMKQPASSLGPISDPNALPVLQMQYTVGSFANYLTATLIPQAAANTGGEYNFSLMLYPQSQASCRAE